jgi:F-type H+-transporting ATPase subunit b
LKHCSPHSRFSFRIFGLIAFAVLAAFAALAGPVVVVPVQAVVQQSSEPPAQPAVTSSAVESANPPKTDAAKTEEQENDQYRHAPIVQTLARLLHLDVETAARLFEIINVAVVVLAIVIPLVRLLPKLLRKRSEKVSNDLESARKMTEDANTRLSAVEARLSHLDDEIAKFRTEVEQQIHQDEERSKAALEEESARIIASAEQEVSVAAAQAKRELRHFAADLAIGQAARQLVLTPETDRALIAEFVSEATASGTGNGGRN